MMMTHFTRLFSFQRSIRGIGTVLLVSLLLGCATTVITPELESELGTEMSKEVENQIGLYSSAQLDAYVRAVGERLVSHLDETPYTFHFAVVDQHEPNAFASLGGYVYVSRGLLVQMNSEDELAGVLAHEISHVTRRHHTRQIGRSVGASLLTLPGRAVGVVSENLGNIINTPIEAAGKVYLSSYSRGQETEADEYGMALAAKAGYDPTALIGALEGIEQSVALLTGEHHEESFFDSHPTTPDRVADIRKIGAGIVIVAQPPIVQSEALADKMDGMWWGAQNPQQGVFQEQVYLNADMDFRLAFPVGWATVNTPGYVAARAEDGGAYIALGGSDNALTVTEMADKLVDKMRSNAGLEPAERKAVAVGDWPAELVRYDEESGEERVSLYYLFVSAGGSNFTVTSMGYERYRPVLRETVLSFRPLTTPERNSIGGLRVRSVMVKPGDTLATLGSREGNRWSPELTAVINGLEKGAQPVAGSKLKVVRSERYIPGPG